MDASAAAYSYFLQVSVEYPWIFSCVVYMDAEPCPVPGPFYEVLNFLFRSLHVSYHLTEVPPAEHYVKNRFHFTKSIPPVANSSLDGHFALWVITESRQAENNLSAPVMIGSYDPAVLVHDHLHKNEVSFLDRSVDLFRVYDIYVWMCFMVAVFSCALIIRVLGEWYSTLTRAHIFLILTASGMLLTGLYKSGLLATLLLHREDFLFTDTPGFIEALESSEIRLIVYHDWIYEDFVFSEQTSETPLRHRMHLAIKSNAPIYVPSYHPDQLHDLLDNEQNVLMTNWLAAKYLESQFCNLHVMRLTELEIPQQNMAFAFPVGFNDSMQKHFNAKITFHRNVIDSIEERYEHTTLTSNISRLAACRRDARAGTSKLSIWNLSGCFIILIAGQIIGVVIVFSEFVYARFFQVVLAQ